LERLGPTVDHPSFPLLLQFIPLLVAWFSESPPSCWFHSAGRSPSFKLLVFSSLGAAPRLLFHQLPFLKPSHLILSPAPGSRFRLFFLSVFIKTPVDTDCCPSFLPVWCVLSWYRWVLFLFLNYVLLRCFLPMFPLEVPPLFFSVSDPPFGPTCFFFFCLKPRDKNPFSTPSIDASSFPRAPIWFYRAAQKTPLPRHFFAFLGFDDGLLT